MPAAPLTGSNPRRPDADPTPARVVLIGNPNVGKSTLFTRLGGTRAHTSNFPGTTQATQNTTIDLGGRPVTLTDLPGVYRLEPGRGSESSACLTALETPGVVVCVVLDATNLARNLRLAAAVVHAGTPMVIAINRSDQAGLRGIHTDPEALERELGCPVVLTCATSGQGVRDLRAALLRARPPVPPEEGETPASWARRLNTTATTHATAPRAHEHLSDRLDAVTMHPVAGTALFALVMTGLFWTVFKLATYPMDWIDAGFAGLTGAVAGVLPPGPVASLLTDGVISGVGATVIFLPQICLMFFLIALLEESGYLPRAALLVDRLLRPFGLPGQAFVPLLSAHACAIPGIIAARGIPDRRERLATILVAPLMSCSARIPVYVLLTSLLFADRPALAALAFTGCYVTGAAAGLLLAVAARRTILRGPSRTLAMELPAYRRPSLVRAAAVAGDRGGVFLRKAGTVILAMVVMLWWLGAYPHSPVPESATALRTLAAQTANPDEADTLLARAQHDEDRSAKAHSFMGIAGRTAAPVFAPLGFDWQLTVGVLSSFAAREVFVSTMAVVLAEDQDAAESRAGLDRLARARRDDGSPVFTKPAAWSLLVFFILAMQCLPTLAVTARETGSWKWAMLQLGSMSSLAYAAAFVTYRVALGVLT